MSKAEFIRFIKKLTTHKMTRFYLFRWRPSPAPTWTTAALYPPRTRGKWERGISWCTSWWCHQIFFQVSVEQGKGWMNLILVPANVSGMAASQAGSPASPNHTGGGGGGGSGSIMQGIDLVHVYVICWWSILLLVSHAGWVTHCV